MKISDFERVCDEHDKLTEQVVTVTRQLAEAQGVIERQNSALAEIVDCYVMGLRTVPGLKSGTGLDRPYRIAKAALSERDKQSAAMGTTK